MGPLVMIIRHMDQYEVAGEFVTVRKIRPQTARGIDLTVGNTAVPDSIAIGDHAATLASRMRWNAFTHTC